ncbi:MAG: serine/threonine protein kinase, partial [Myxococcales bacterium]|nr:serine/threonine protein kinase [Myxococcales bacterium]
MTGHDPADNDEALSRSLDVLMPRPGGGVVEALSAELAAARLCASLCDEPLELRIADRYRLLEELGAGGMGVVYRAHDVTLERDVAIKLLQSLPGRDGTRDPARRDRLLEEARTLAKLRDPHVVPVFEVGTHRGEVFMVMELVEGLELGAWVEATKPKVKEILAAYVQAGRGLAAAHELDIIHRDFKPANARRDPKGHVRVLDFGLAAQDQGSSVRDCVSAGSSDVASALTRALVGTPRYMAPEQREGRGVSAASDQYSFCVALHEALTGAPPSTERADASALAGRLPRWLQRVLQRGLQPDPALRYPSMRALLDELARD